MSSLFLALTEKVISTLSSVSMLILVLLICVGVDSVVGYLTSYPVILSQFELFGAFNEKKEMYNYK